MAFLNVVSKLLANLTNTDLYIGYKMESQTSTNSAINELDPDLESSSQKFAVVRDAISRIKGSSSIKLILQSLQDEMDDLKRENAKLSAAVEVYREWKGDARSFADVARASASGNNNSSIKPVNKPPAIVNVYPSNVDDASNSNSTKIMLTSKIKTSGVRVTGMRPKSGCGVSVLCSSENDAIKLKERINECCDLKAETPQKKRPCFTFFVPNKDEAVDLDELRETILEKNDFILGEDDGFKIVNRRDVRAGGTVVTVEVSPENYQSIKNNTSMNGSTLICLQWTSTVLREKDPTRQCFKCFGFAHVAKHCRDANQSNVGTRCTKCGDNHLPNNCPRNRPCCVNCHNMNLKAAEKKWKNWAPLDTSHQVNWRECPIYKKATFDARLMVDYGF